MTNKEFADLLISKIERHKHKLCDGKNGPVNAAYAQAHIHIIEIIGVLKNQCDDEPAKIAHWIRKKVDKYHYDYYCDHCFYKSPFKKSNFCPDCGFLMAKEEKKG